MDWQDIDSLPENELREYAKQLEAELWKYIAPDFVYFLRDPVSRRIKIGHSKNVAKRRIVLSREVGHDLQIMGTMPGGRTLKRQLRKKFSAFEVEDEWFKPDELLLRFIEANAQVRQEHRET